MKGMKEMKGMKRIKSEIHLRKKRLCCSAALAEMDLAVLLHSHIGGNKCDLEEK